MDISLSFLLAIDLDALGSIKLGSVLDIGKILPCLLSSAREASLTELQVSVQEIDFEVEGFQSPEVSNAVADSTRVILQEFGDVILASLPAFFDTTVRALLNNWVDYYLSQESSTSCPSKISESSTQSFVDFRDLFLTEPGAVALGGVGTSPYGNLFRTLLDFANDYVLKVDPATGLAAINDVLVGPLSRMQSGTTGSLMFLGDLFNQGSRVAVGGLDARIQLQARDLHISNVDSIGSPLSILDPVINTGTLLNNTATFGVGNPISIAFNFMFSLLGDGKHKYIYIYIYISCR